MKRRRAIVDQIRSQLPQERSTGDYYRNKQLQAELLVAAIDQEIDPEVQSLLRSDLDRARYTGD
jgi:hypothetical protein